MTVASSGWNSVMTRTLQLKTPFGESEARALGLGDHVILDGEIIITAGLPTHERIFAYMHEGKSLPIDLHGAAFFHLGSYSQDSNGHFDVLYMNPTTSTRFNRFMPSLIREFGLHAVGGKGGLDAECARAMAEVGCVYLSFLGGGAPLLSAAITEIVDVAWPDLVSHYRLVKLRVRELGPLVVAIDAHGRNMYEELQNNAREALPGIFGRLGERRKS
jgi:fumarate hydratase subunit beta